jgi:hypothetical protein
MESKIWYAFFIQADDTSNVERNIFYRVKDLRTYNLDSSYGISYLITFPEDMKKVLHSLAIM